jgi:hypothetical protein
MLIKLTSSSHTSYHSLVRGRLAEYHLTITGDFLSWFNFQYISELNKIRIDNLLPRFIGLRVVR